MEIETLSQQPQSGSIMEIESVPPQQQSESTMEIENEPPSPQQSGKTSFPKTCLNGINALVGFGILSMPYAISLSGWLGLVFLCLIVILLSYTGVLIGRCMLSHPHIKTYSDVGNLAFGIKGKLLVALFTCLELYLVAVEVLIMEGDNLEKLFPNIDFKIGGLKVGGKRAFIFLTALVVMPTTWLKTLGVLAYVSAGGILVSVILVGCVLWAGAVDGVGFHERGSVVKWSGLPTAMSLFIFCYAGHAIFPTLCTSTRDKTQFSKVLIVSFALSTINYGSMAILGYLMFGESLNSQITLNLPGDKISSKLAIFTTLVIPLTKYAILIMPVANSIENAFPILNSSRPRIIIFRTMLVISTAVVALTIPFFDLIMEFIGSFLCVGVSMILPCIFYVKINRASIGFGIEFMAIMTILALGIYVAGMGIYNSILNIVNHI